MSRTVWAADEQVTDFDGWRRVTLEGVQVAPRFRNDSGSYRCGLFPLLATDWNALVREVVERDSTSVVTFAIVDASVSVWSPPGTSAFRHDLDFYLFTSMTEPGVQSLNAFLTSNGPPIVLCLTTHLPFRDAALAGFWGAR